MTLREFNFAQERYKTPSDILTFVNAIQSGKNMWRALEKVQTASSDEERKMQQCFAAGYATEFICYLWVIPPAWENLNLQQIFKDRAFEASLAKTETRAWQAVAAFHKATKGDEFREKCKRHFPSNFILKSQFHNPNLLKKANANEVDL